MREADRCEERATRAECTRRAQVAHESLGSTNHPKRRMSGDLGIKRLNSRELLQISPSPGALKMDTQGLPGQTIRLHALVTGLTALGVRSRLGLPEGAGFGQRFGSSQQY